MFHDNLYFFIQLLTEVNKMKKFSAQHFLGRPRLKVFTMMSCAIIISACASKPVPTTQLALARVAVTEAISADAAEYAPLELKTAQEKLNRAHMAVSKKENDQ